MQLDPWCGMTRPLRRSRVAVSVAVALAIVGCNDTPSEPKVGSLQITITGLPTGQQGSVVVDGPPGSNFQRPVTATSTLDGLTAGTYTISAQPVNGTLGAFTAAPETQQALVSAGASQSATVT
jgi:hypothetical protein